MKKILNLVSVLFLTSLMLFVGCKHDADLSVDPVDPGKWSISEGLYSCENFDLLVFSDKCYFGYHDEYSGYTDGIGNPVKIFYSFNYDERKIEKELSINSEKKVKLSEEVAGDPTYSKLTGDYFVYEYDDPGDGEYFAVIKQSGNIYILVLDDSLDIKKNIIGEKSKCTMQIVEECEYIETDIYDDDSNKCLHLKTYKLNGEIFYVIY